MLTRLAHVTLRHRRIVIAAWVLLTLFGVFAAGQVSTRWYQSLAVPGKPAYDASQRTLKAFGTGDRTPSVVVFHTSGDATGRTSAGTPGHACRGGCDRPGPGPGARL